MNRARLAAAALLAGAVLFAGITLLRTDHGRALATSPLELIPASDRSPELDAVRQLAGDAHARIMLAEIRSPSGHAKEAAAAVAESLRHDPVAPGITAIDPMDMDARKATGEALFAGRFELLFPRTLAKLRRECGPDVPPEKLAEKAADRLDAFMKSDTAFAFEKLLPADPLLLVPEATAPLMKDSRPALSPQRALLWIDPHRDPLTAAGRDPVFAALARARAAMHAAEPDATLLRTGVNLFAAASERKIRRDLELLNFIAIGAVAGVCVLRLRTLAILPHAFAITLLSLATSWATTLLIFGRVHVFAVSLGALLSGVCVDFALYVMLHGERDDRPASFERLRPVLAPLFSGGLVAAAGFAFLILSPLPAMRQTGVLASTGIFYALIFAVAYGSLVRFRAPRRFAEARPATKPARRRDPRFALICLAAPLAAGVIFLNFSDSLNDLQPKLDELRATDREIRGAFGEESRTVWLAEGATVGEALTRMNAFDAAVRAKTGGKAQVRSPAMMLATPAEHAAADRFLREDGERFATAFAAALKRRDYDPADFAPFFDAWKKACAGLARPGEATDRFLAALTGPESLLVSRKDGFCLLVCWTDAAARIAEPDPDTGILPANSLESLNLTLSGYRRNLVLLAISGLAVTMLAAVAIRRSLSALGDFAPPVFATAAVAGAAGWSGMNISMFHIAGAFLALCCSLNYSIFARAAKRRGEAFPGAVTLAWLAGAASFGTLAFSRLPAVAALGATVAIILTATYATVRSTYACEDR